MEIRSYRPADTPGVSRLISRRGAADGRSALSEHKAMRLGHQSSVELVGVVDDAIVAYAHAAHHEAPGAAGHWAIEVVVAPGREAAGAPFATLVAQLRHLLPVVSAVTVWAWRDDEIAAARSLAWPEVRALYQMIARIPLAGSREMPEGVELRTFARGVDEAAWLEANHAAFSEHRENAGVDRQNLEARMRQPWFDPAGFLLAWEDDALLGFCWTKLHSGRTGEIYIIGVVPAAQGRGLGAALLQAGLHDLATRQGATEAMLYVGADDTRALQLYGTFGFRVTFTNREFAVPGEQRS